MRKFSSYGPVDTDIEYYVPREDLVNKALNQLVGEIPEKGGHYFTVWAPRQTGKTWLLRETFIRIKADDRFMVMILPLQSYDSVTDELYFAQELTKEIAKYFKISLPFFDNLKDFKEVFTSQYFKKPLILILDEFDALEGKVIQKIVARFRDIFLNRKNETSKSAFEKTYILHGVALIGVRSVLGIDNKTGSPFNIQRSIHVPNLTKEEVQEMFDWYQRESNQKIEQDVVDDIFYETQGQPGLVSWFGELLTETYNKETDNPINFGHWKYALSCANQTLPNNTIMNLISKANQPEYKPYLLDIFRTTGKVEFTFDDPVHNYLYMNGIIRFEEVFEENENKKYAKFTCPFIQKRLFNRFRRELFDSYGTVYIPFEDLSDSIIRKDREIIGFNIPNILRRYEKYLRMNRDWILKDAPRRKDNKITEAVFHFNIVGFLETFLHQKAHVYPEFPTGNGKVDILIRKDKLLYIIEIKSFTDEDGFYSAIDQASQYAQSLNLNRIVLAVFVESLNEDMRTKFENDIIFKNSDITVSPVFIVTGN